MDKVKYYRWSPVLGDFEESPEKIWGVKPYNPDSTESCVFCGLYGLPDFYALWRYKGKKYIFWAGSDIRHFTNGYWLDNKGEIRLNPPALARWIALNCESWVENEVEADKLAHFGIVSNIAPSFLGDVENFTPQILKPEKRYYSSVSGDDFKLYNWEMINEYAEDNLDTEYHLYGNTKPWIGPKNVIVHGRVSKEVMNEETKTMTGCIRLVEFEGCSEILVKSVLWGQKPISLIDYPFLHTENPREELLKILNRYPWNIK